MGETGFGDFVFRRERLAIDFDGFLGDFVFWEFRVGCFVWFWRNFYCL